MNRDNDKFIIPPYVYLDRLKSFVRQEVLEIILYLKSKKIFFQGLS